ncbi:MAG: insulinase family protein [Proteobacteria bacterium]|nr:insulinase family protein [Pseudomonadota bacterium]
MVHKTVLENGVRVISERLDHFRSVSLGIWVDVGSRDEVSEENGISHFIEHMIFKGTARRSSFQIAKDLDAIGGLSNAFTGTEYTCFHSRVLDKHLDPLTEVLSDIFLNSVFEPEEMDRERQVIFQEINMQGDTPDEHIHTLFSQLFWMNHPLGMPVLGTPETVSAIAKQTIGRYIKRYYTPERILVVAAGNVDHSQLVSLFRSLFETLPKAVVLSPRVAPESHAGISCYEKDLEQVHLCLGGRAPHLSSSYRFAAAVLNTILGGNMSSRLFQEIREKRGLAYSVYSFLAPYVDAGLLGIYVGTVSGEVNRVLRIVEREVMKIQKRGLSKRDLMATKEHLVGGILLGSENTDSRMMRLAKNEYIFGRDIPYEELLSEVQRVTVDEVVDVAREAFQRESVSLATLGPIRREDLDLAVLQFNERARVPRQRGRRVSLPAGR